MMMWKGIAWPLAAGLLLAGAGAGADEPPSVQVQTIVAHRGALPATVVAYGTAGPALDGGMTMSVPVEGRVIGLAVTPGEVVHAGDKLIDFAPSAQAISAHKQAVAALRLARQSKAHAEELFRQQLATRDQVEQADKAIIDARATLDALDHEVGGKSILVVKAPFDGIVTGIPVAQGDRTAAGTPLVTLMRADGLVVTVGIEPVDLALIRKGEPARLASLTGNDKPVTGTVLRVDGMVNAKTRLVDADISLPPGVLSGQTFRAVITVGAVQGWLVPRDAVLTDDKGAYVLQVTDGKAVRVEVTSLGTDADVVAVEGALASTRPVVVQGNYQLSDGMAVHQGKQP